MDLEELRSEYRNMLLNGTLAEALDTKCVNCGSTENIEFHHIVPLLLGCTNRLRNIVPLCNRCHKAAHRGRHISHYQNTKNSGRKSNVTDEEAFSVLDKWADGQIGNKKCAELMGAKYSEKRGFTITSLVQYKKWCEIRGYRSVKNILDLKATNSPKLIDESSVVVFISHINKPVYQTETVCFHDTGENNDVLYKVRGAGEYIRFSEILKK